MAVIGYEIICGLTQRWKRATQVTLSIVIRHRASGKQPVALISELISQFSILTKLTTCKYWDSQQYNFTQTGKLYLFLVELKN